MERKLIFLIFVVNMSLIDAAYAVPRMDANNCPTTVPENGQAWTKENKKGFRCILQCNAGYVPSGCKVIRKKDGKWNHDIPGCVKESLVSGKTLLAIAAGVGTAVAAPYALPLLGFGTTGVTAGSAAAWYQGPATAAGSLFATFQSAGAAGVAVTTMAALGTAATTVFGSANAVYSLITCERA